MSESLTEPRSLWLTQRFCFKSEISTFLGQKKGARESVFSGFVGQSLSQPLSATTAAQKQLQTVSVALFKENCIYKGRWWA